MNLKFFKW